MALLLTSPGLLVVCTGSDQSLCSNYEHLSCTKACICAGYEEEEEEYGYPGHMQPPLGPLLYFLLLLLTKVLKLLLIMLFSLTHNCP